MAPACDDLPAGLCLAYLNGAHVRVDLWRESRSPRTKAWVEVGGLLVLGIPMSAC